MAKDGGSSKIFPNVARTPSENPFGRTLVTAVGPYAVEHFVAAVLQREKPLAINTNGSLARAIFASAERERFELSVQVYPVRRFSKPLV